MEPTSHDTLLILQALTPLLFIGLWLKCGLPPSAEVRWTALSVSIFNIAMPVWIWLRVVL